MFGVSQVVKNLGKIKKKFPDHLAAAAYQEMQVEAVEMKKRTPVDTTKNAPHPGRLRNSIRVLRPEQKGNTITVAVATGKEAPYAVHVHENPDAIHPIGEWKFMESVLNESRSSMGARIARRAHLNKLRGL